MAVKTGIGQFGFGPKTHRYAEAGKYFTATNPTVGTGIIGMVSTTDDATKPTILFANNNQAGSGVNCYLDYIRLCCTVVGVGHSAPKVSFRLDTGKCTDRYTSGATLITPNNTNSGSNNGSNVYLRFGAVTAAAAGNDRLICSHAITSGAIEVVYDSFVFDFGAPSHSMKASLIDNTTTLTHGYFSEPPVVIAPQTCFTAIIWGASNSTGITWAFDIGWIEA
jgi:hypothetical protein